MINRITEQEFAKICEFAKKEKEIKNKGPIAIAVCDEAMNLVFLSTMDGLHCRTAFLASVKASTAAKMEKTTKALRDSCKANGFNLSDYACADKMTLMPGGAPIFDENGQTIGGVGISGWLADEDQELAIACADLIKTGRG